MKKKSQKSEVFQFASHQLTSDENQIQFVQASAILKISNVVIYYKLINIQWINY